MKEETLLTASIGKEIAGVSFSGKNGQCAISFTDGTFACLGIEHAWEAQDSEVAPRDLDFWGFGDVFLIEAGIVTESEMDALRKERAESEKIRQYQEQYERDMRELKRIQEKYADKIAQGAA